jgi:hypothetical protein
MAKAVPLIAMIARPVAVKVSRLAPTTAHAAIALPTAMTVQPITMIARALNVVVSAIALPRHVATLSMPSQSVTVPV